MYACVHVYVIKGEEASVSAGFLQTSPIDWRFSRREVISSLLGDRFPRSYGRFSTGGRRQFNASKAVIIREAIRLYLGFPNSLLVPDSWDLSQIIDRCAGRLDFPFAPLYLKNIPNTTIGLSRIVMWYRNFQTLRFTLLPIAIGLVLTTSVAQAQIQHGGQPYSSTHAVRGEVPVETMRPVDVDALRAEDRAARQSDRPVPPRFGTALDVSLGINNAGRWTELPKGGRLWRLRIASQGAHSINLIFDKYHLPSGGELFIYNQDRSTVLGAFTEANNKPYGRFSTLPIEGAVITVEYYEPAEHRGETDLRVSKVIHAYRNLFAGNDESSHNGFGTSEDCNINVNCKEGKNWQDESRSVAMVLVDESTRWCSGVLVNNEALSLTPYILCLSLLHRR